MHDDDGAGAFPFDRALAVAVERSPWFRILDTLEAAVGLAAASAAVVGAASGGLARPAPWTPPSNPGPLPGELVDRARRLQALQANAMQALESTLRSTARHLAAVQSVPDAGGSGRSAFLDVTG
ncbi:MAG TPA: hypothetical protein VIG41_12385 [Micrococcaceae bacterium]|jgi:hypothetical protein